MKTYKYKITEPCEICGKYDKSTILSINPNKKTLTPFHANDLVPLSCGHRVKALGRKVSLVKERMLA